ncbi:hypothetical protein GDO81_008926 [Engystomops pustulosus]|uniref:Uncharacterized protein n=1 Tax=Engystomops pustulosus TaxID=76066 RepID=A0AAV7BN14_ENGPU|nr:hypothetical protein GDO81_008926 [Engystomops pustulosus]
MFMVFSPTTHFFRSQHCNFPSLHLCWNKYLVFPVFSGSATFVGKEMLLKDGFLYIDGLSQVVYQPCKLFPFNLVFARGCSSPRGLHL